MKPDSKLREDVLEELNFDPSVPDSNIAVSAKDGIVTLSGFVPSYADKFAAEKAAFRVAGVKAVAEEIEVKLPGASIRSDEEIAKAASDAIRWNVHVPDAVKITVEDGVVVLRGDVEWQFQRDAATSAVRYLTGVKAVNNRLTIRKAAQPSDIKQRIEKALVRSAEADAKKIAVSTSDGQVTLRGKVRSHAEAEDARWAAWAAPGVRSVENLISIG